MDEHVPIGHLDRICPGVGVRDAHKAGVAWRLGRVMGHRVDPEKMGEKIKDKGKKAHCRTSTVVKKEAAMQTCLCGKRLTMKKVPNTPPPKKHPHRLQQEERSATEREMCRDIRKIIRRYRKIVKSCGTSSKCEHSQGLRGGLVNHRGPL